MSDVLRLPYSVASREMIAKLIKSGLLKPAQRHDPDAIEDALARLRTLSEKQFPKPSDDGPTVA